MQAISVQIPKLVRTIGASSHLLEIIADPPAGSENLLMQVLYAFIYSFILIKMVNIFLQVVLIPIGCANTNGWGSSISGIDSYH